MLYAALALLSFQLIGETFARLLALPIPGPVIGMGLLCALLSSSRVTTAQPLHRTTDGLLKHLSLLFVPAGVGVVTHLGRMVDEIVPIGVSLVASIGVAVAATALWMQRGVSKRGSQ